MQIVENKYRDLPYDLELLMIFGRLNWDERGMVGMLSEKEVLIRLFIAVLLGGLIGWEREIHDRPAGFRTHILVSVGSALIMIVSIGMSRMFEGAPSDPGRIAAQVVSGIGFLGAGTIIREGVNIKGLTTAASLWTVAGIGLAVGAGFTFSAFVTAGLVFITLIFLNKLELASRKNGWKLVELRAVDRPGLLGDLGRVVGEDGLNIAKISMKSHSDDDLVIVRMKLTASKGFSADRLNRQLYQINGIRFVEWIEKGK